MKNNFKEKIKVDINQQKKDNNKKKIPNSLGAYPFDAEEMLLKVELKELEAQKGKN